jgi:pimeloyl-ACP methyl ester carboxylesterase
MPKLPSPIRHTLRTAAALSPRLAARLAQRLWFTPPRTPLSEAAAAMLGTGQRLNLSIDGRQIRAWRFGEGRAVALMHGWGGRAGQLLSFIEPLRAAGFAVVLFDALGHGHSDPSPAGWRQATFYDFAAGLAAVNQLEPLFGLVTHSGGAVATGIAIRNGLNLERVAFIAPMTRPERYARPFSEALALSEEVHRQWQSLALNRIGAQWSTLDVTTLPVTHHTPEALVVHDRNDREVPFADGEALVDKWPSARLIATVDLGHRRILAAPSVAHHVASFLSHGHLDSAAA